MQKLHYNHDVTSVPLGSNFCPLPPCSGKQMSEPEHSVRRRRRVAVSPHIECESSDPQG